MSPSARSSATGFSSSCTKLGGVERAGLAGRDLGVAGLLQDHRQPADLQFGAVADGDVGAARLGDQARPRLDLVRVLRAGGGGVDGDLVAADFGRQRAPFRLAGEDVEIGVGRCRDGEAWPARRRGCSFFMMSPLSVAMGAVRPVDDGVLQQKRRRSA